MCLDIGISPMPLSSLGVGLEDFPKAKSRNQIMLTDSSGAIRLDLRGCETEDSTDKIINGTPCCAVGFLNNGQLCVEKLIYPTPASPSWPDTSGDVETVFLHKIVWRIEFFD